MTKFQDRCFPLVVTLEKKIMMIVVTVVGMAGGSPSILYFTLCLYNIIIYIKLHHILIWPKHGPLDKPYVRTVKISYKTGRKSNTNSQLPTEFFIK